MHLSIIDIAAGGAALLAIWMCGIMRLSVTLKLLAAQTCCLAGIVGVLGWQRHAWHLLILAGVVLFVKGLAIPAYLAWSAQRLQVHRDMGVYLHPTPSLLLGCVILIVGFLLAPQFAVPALGNPGAAGMALTLVMTGMLVMMTRRLALSQVVGFLMLENGIFLYGVTQTQGMPLTIEMGMILDILVAVMVAGIIIYRLNRSFEHIDVTQLRGLRH